MSGPAFALLVSFGPAVLVALLVGLQMRHLHRTGRCVTCHGHGCDDDGGWPCSDCGGDGRARPERADDVRCCLGCTALAAVVLLAAAAALSVAFP